MQPGMSHPAYGPLMAQGSRLHEAGKLAQALACFEQALAIAPTSVNVASACATVLTELGRPDDAFAVLHALRDPLLQDADGATNYAIAAEACHRLEEARDAYARALALAPNHLRALTNAALLAAQDADWDNAVEGLRRCCASAPHDPTAWLNLIDTLVAARRFGDAQTVLAQALQRWPGATPLAVRHALVLAFDGQFAAGQAALDALDAQGQAQLQGLLQAADRSSRRDVRKARESRADAHELFCQQAFEAMQVCDWRDHDRLTGLLRELLAQAARSGVGRDWRDAQLCGLMLPLHEDEMAQMRRLSIDTIGRRLPVAMPAFVASLTLRSDGRIRVGLAIQDPRDPRVAHGLQRQLAWHDHTRFAIQVYAPTTPADADVLRQTIAAPVTVHEIGHLRDDEAVARMREDGLDIFVDMAFDTPWCRPEIPQYRVAPIQLRQTTWHRHHPPRPCDYNMSDTFVHPDGLDLRPYGAVVRLPLTCWLAPHDEPPDPTLVHRAAFGLRDDALVLCAMLPALMLDPQSFGLWMDMLRRLPAALLWLPPYGVQARRNLQTAARQAGVDPARLVFQPRGSRRQILARLPLADLVVDGVRFNANQGLVDALRMGVPAVTCAGNSMASRLGGSILRACQLVEGITFDTAAFTDRVLQLGRDPALLRNWRAQLAALLPAAPLFDAAARVREWETAWDTMVQRQRTGLAAAAFDVPPQAPSPTIPVPMAKDART